MIRKTFLWMTYWVLLLGVTACENDFESNTEALPSGSDVTQNVRRSVELSSGYSMYGIDISERWGYYNIPDQRPEIVRSILESGNAVVAVCLSQNSPSPTTASYEVGFNPYVDNGWRLLLDGSGHDKMILTHVNATDNPTGRSVELPISGFNPVPSYLCFHSGTYTMESGFNSVDISHYHLYVFIGCNQYKDTNRFYGCWISLHIPITGEAIYLGHGKLPESDWMYPKLDLMHDE